MSHHNQRSFRSRANTRTGYQGGMGDTQKRGPCRRQGHDHRIGQLARCVRCGLPRPLNYRKAA